MFFGNPGSTVSKPRLLLHSCCGPCSSAVIERLLPDYDITVFFYNPCITDREEYEKRRDAQIQLINALNLDVCTGGSTINYVEGDYEPASYLELVEGLEDAPEGGERCKVCFEMRLAKTAAYASASGYSLFTTTLTVSPHKNYVLITEIGKRYAEKYGIEYLDRDFKKKAGFQRSVQLSRQYGLYRQDYCGCDFSRRK
jgi:predicted adenine nucleotide alpha hydrolase (AANH) superfamily ATPase